MSWSCDRCARGDGESEVDAVCHHCGALLCSECRYEILDTELVGRRPGESDVAVHCASCRREHHRFSVPVVRLGFQ